MVVKQKCLVVKQIGMVVKQNCLVVKQKCLFIISKIIYYSVSKAKYNKHMSEIIKFFCFSNKALAYSMSHIKLLIYIAY